ncbi:hypothetical protein MVEN_00753600 [Mycena venus]|uniref:Uncharacterized protein n=1 Tax=Mycena venus TaxID=2733690 RepID=A0A8H6YI72_9AGAR|nr:hypothetical protein MVEN_00753600 [Mycena venus]
MVWTGAIRMRRLPSALLSCAIFFIAAASGAFETTSDDICSGLITQYLSDADDWLTPTAGRTYTNTIVLPSNLLEYSPDYAFDLWCRTLKDDGGPSVEHWVRADEEVASVSQDIELDCDVTPDEITLPHRAQDVLLGFGETVASFTLLREIEAAVEQAEYVDIQTQLRNEWLKVGGVLMGLMTLESAAFALTADSLLAPTNLIARFAIAVASIATAAGLLCDAYLLLRFSRASIQAFKRRAEDGYRVRGENDLPGSGTPVRTYIMFAILARLPLLLALLAMACITALLGAAAYALSPLAVLGVLSVVSGVLTLRYLFWALLWTVFAVSRMSAIVSRLYMRVVRSVRG